MFDDVIWRVALVMRGRGGLVIVCCEMVNMDCDGDEGVGGFSTVIWMVALVIRGRGVLVIAFCEVEGDERVGG